MNSPLRDHERIILRFPLSLSTMSGELIVIEAHKALNGLRVASLTWSVFLKDIVSKVEGQPLLQYDRAMSLWWSD